jgi:transcriptional regulator with XRE-family HTH domain
MGKRTKQFLEDLKSWCNEERGRQKAISEVANISKQAVSNWFAGRQEPTAEQLLAIQEYLAKRD